MGSAAYYAQYLHHLAQKDKFQKWIDYLTDVKSALNDKLNDEIDDVNIKINELQQNLYASVRHNETFKNNADSFYSRKEKDVGTDSKLSAARDSITSEIKDLIVKRDAEDAAAQKAYAQYLAEKEREEEEMRRAAEAVKQAVTSVFS